MNILLKLQNILYPLDELQSVTVELLRQLNFSVPSNYIKKKLEEHPAFPSLLCISDVLEGLEIKNIAAKIKGEEIKNMPLPMIVQIEEDQNRYLAILTKYDANLAVFINTNRNNDKRKIPIETFNKMFTGIVLIIEIPEHKNDIEFNKIAKEEKKELFSKITLFLLLPVFTVFICFLTYFIHRNDSVYAIVYTLLTLAGSFVTFLLVWYEIDQYNSALQQICSLGGKKNCARILQSKAAKIFGVSWSTIGFTYFTGALLALIFTELDATVLSILAWLNLIAVPYVFFSVYYQAKIAKQWCILCLSVQLVLILQFITALSGGGYFLTTEIYTNSLITVLFSFLITFGITMLLVSEIRKGKTMKKRLSALERFKHNDEIFNVFLKKQKFVSAPRDLGIILGNVDADYHIIKVCNPYCNPCSIAHPKIEKLLESRSNILVQILFTANGRKDDIKTPPVQHLLAINEKGDEDLIKNALNDWYSAPDKDYQTFQKKYPLQNELTIQNEKIQRMWKWCSENDIRFTPTLFLNGFQLPEMYDLEDLIYFIPAYDSVE